MSLHVSQADLAALLRLESIGPGQFRSVAQERNANDRIYGGQLLAQLLLAASDGVDQERLPSVLQMVFLQGAVPDTPVDYHVDLLQQGARFSSRHVSARQGELSVADGHVSFQRLGDGASHAITMPPTPPPEQGCMPWEASEEVRELIGRTFTAPVRHPVIELRAIDAAETVRPTSAGRPMHLWSRIGHRLPDSPRLHAAALAYLSDWWLNFAGAAPHLQDSGGLYVVSLNHSMWFHAPCRADEWILCVNHSPNAGAQRSLSLGEFFTQDGRHVATVAQQALMAPPRRPT